MSCIYFILALLISDSMGKSVRLPNLARQSYGGKEILWFIKKVRSEFIKVASYNKILLQVGTVDVLNIIEDKYLNWHNIHDSYKVKEFVSRILDLILSLLWEIRLFNMDAVVIVSSNLPIPRHQDISYIFLKELNKTLFRTIQDFAGTIFLDSAKSFDTSPFSDKQLFNNSELHLRESMVHILEGRYSQALSSRWIGEKLLKQRKIIVKRLVHSQKFGKKQ